jgi:hypothetical protein
VTLTPKDIERIQELYKQLDLLRRLRKTAADAPRFHINAETNAKRLAFLGVFDGDVGFELQKILCRDLRKRAGVIVEELHKLGCEAVLTPVGKDADG